jgi:predicted secreted protein
MQIGSSGIATGNRFEGYTCKSMLPDPKNLTVHQGDKFEIRLQSVPSTGYILQVGVLPEQLELLDSTFEPGGPGNPRPGAPVTQIFRFRALKAGHAQITFESRRSWEKTPASTSGVEVEIT